MERNNILIVDDDIRNIFALNAVLRSKGFHCITATSAASGIDVLQKENIGLALIDMMMPDMDGFQMINKIKQIDGLQAVPLIAVTALAMAGDKEKCLASGADGYISKPINVDVLLDVLKKYLS